MKISLCIAFVMLFISQISAGQTLPALPSLDVGGNPSIVGPTTLVRFLPSNVGDVDGDGCEDYFLAALHNPINNVFDPVQHLVSGKDGTSIDDLDPSFNWSSSATGTSLIETHDIDGDGINDYGYFIPKTFSGPSIVEFRSGVSLNVLGGANYIHIQGFVGVRVAKIARVGDVTGDGVDDIALASTLSSTTVGNFRFPTSFLDVIDGVTFQRTNIAFLHGIELDVDGLVAIEDVDGDGFPDIVVSSSVTPFFAVDGGSATIYSSQTGASIRNFVGSAGEKFGSAMVGVDDLDNDGVKDLAIFSPGSNSVGRVEVFSSSTGSRLVNILPSSGERFVDLREAGDHNGDGISDFVIEVENTASAAVRSELRSSHDGSLIAMLGLNEHPVGDLNGDGIDDFVQAIENVPNGGDIRFQSRTRLGAQAYGPNSTTASFRWMPGIVQGAMGQLALEGAPPSTPIIGIVSFAPANTIVSGTLLPLLVSTNPSDVYGWFPKTTDAFGDHFDPVNLEQPGLAGIHVYVQYGLLGATPSTTNGIELLFGPN